MVSTQLKNISQNGSSPQVGVKIKNVWNHHLEFFFRPKPTNLKDQISRPKKTHQNPPKNKRLRPPKTGALHRCLSPFWKRIQDYHFFTQPLGLRILKGSTSWWLNQPVWKICSSKWESSLSRGENKKSVKPPPRSNIFSTLAEICQ